MIRRCIALSMHVGHQPRSEILAVPVEDWFAELHHVVDLWREIKGADPLGS